MTMKILMVLFIVISAAVGDTFFNIPEEQLKKVSSADGVKNLVKEAKAKGTDINWDDGWAKQASSASCTVAPSGTAVMLFGPKPKTFGEFKAVEGKGYIGCADRKDCSGFIILCIVSGTPSESSGNHSGGSGGSDTTTISSSSNRATHFTLLAILAYLYL